MTTHGWFSELLHGPGAGQVAAVGFHPGAHQAAGKEGFCPRWLPIPSPSLPVTCKTCVVATAFFVSCQHVS